MKVKVLSRDDFNAAMMKNNLLDNNVENHKESLFISIAGTYSSDYHWFKDNHKNVLNLNFDDLDFRDWDLYHGQKLEGPGKTFFDTKMADEIIKFIEDNKKTAKNLYIHCTMGVSRSGAVGVTINDYYGDDNYEMFMRNNPQISPNAFVKSRLARAYFIFDDGTKTES